MVFSRREETSASAPRKEEILARIKDCCATFSGSVGSGKSGDSQFGDQQHRCLSPYYVSISYPFVTRP